MERLFSPCTRLHDILESQGRLERVRRHHPEYLQELNLNVSTDEFLSAETVFTFADLHAMLLGNENTIAWLTPHAAVDCEGGRAALWFDHVPHCRFTFNADGKDIYAFARSPENLLEICDVVVRLLAVSVLHRAFLNGPYINAPTLEYLMQHCQSLKVLSLVDLEMDEDIIRVLGAYSRPDLEIELVSCKTTSAGASALAEVLGRNQGPTKLYLCKIENLVLANGLRGNSRLES
jgi:hypothetical protein